MSDKLIRRGGPDPERLYFHDADFLLDDETRVVVSRSAIPTAAAGMEDVFARHLGAYGLVALFCRPGKRVLDVPCGSGYAADLLREFGISYEGIDLDLPTVEYARRVHGRGFASFRVGDMRSLDLRTERYNVIACLEGIEHIDQPHQDCLIEALQKGLVPGGVLVISSPEAASGVSGPSSHNPYHKWELTKGDFLKLLHRHFRPGNVETVTRRNIRLSTGAMATCLYAVCHREP